MPANLPVTVAMLTLPPVATLMLAIAVPGTLNWLAQAWTLGCTPFMAPTMSLWPSEISLTEAALGEPSSPPPFLLPTSPSRSSRDFAPFLPAGLAADAPSPADGEDAPADSPPFFDSAPPLPADAWSPPLRRPLSPLPEPVLDLSAGFASEAAAAGFSSVAAGLAASAAWAAGGAATPGCVATGASATGAGATGTGARPGGGAVTTLKMMNPSERIPTLSKPSTGKAHFGGPPVDMGRSTGATGENCGVEKVGSASNERRTSPGEPSLRVIAAIERMSMSPEPSVFVDADGDRMPPDCAGTASASRFERENSTEFSLRWPVRCVEPAPLPPEDRLTAGSAGCVGDPPPKRNGEDGAGAATADADAPPMAEAKRSAVPAGLITVGAAKGSASTTGAAATALIEPEARAGSRAAGLVAAERAATLGSRTLGRGSRSHPGNLAALTLRTTRHTRPSGTEGGRKVVAVQRLLWIMNHGPRLSPG